eukprot:m.30084 g.30084  ORF g.30084 m.30084 type:complete len:671 (-) comp9352_c0_seq2:116-2128(-)
MSTRRTKSSAASAAERLERENQLMEQRLAELKASQRARKDARAGQSSTWRSGQRGTIRGHASKVLSDNSARRQHGKRMVVLKGDEAEAEACGQCSHRRATLWCGECGEQYCRACSDKFHRKGALARHQLTPLSKADGGGGAGGGDGGGGGSTQRSLGSASSRSAGSAGSSGDGRGATSSGCGTDTAGTLLDGEFDEEGSHQSFRDAVAEWRKGTQQGQGTDTEAGPLEPEYTSGNTFYPRGNRPPTPEGGGGALLRGPAFDEAKNAADFQEAVAAWRAGKSAPAPGPKTWSLPSFGGPAESTEIETETESHLLQRPIVFEETSSLSYLERLMLKRNRSSRPTSSASAAADGSVMIGGRNSSDVVEVVAPASGYVASVVEDTAKAGVGAATKAVVSVVELDAAAHDESTAPSDYVIAEPDDDQDDGDGSGDESNQESHGLQRLVYGSNGDGGNDSADADSLNGEPDDNGIVDLGLERPASVQSVRATMEDVIAFTDLELPDPAAESAAVAIQAAYRGAKARAQASELRQKRDTSAATQIQAGFRGMRARREVSARRQSQTEQAAAVTIQAAFRGSMDRAHCAELREQIKQERQAECALRGSFHRARKAVPLPVPGQQDKIRQLDNRSTSAPSGSLAASANEVAADTAQWDDLEPWDEEEPGSHGRAVSALP